MTEDRKLQALVMPSTSTPGFTLYVLRDPHPAENVPVAFEILSMAEWAPEEVEAFMASKWGWKPAPGATWEKLGPDRYRIRPLIAAEESAK